MSVSVSRSRAFVWACEQQLPPVQKLVLLRMADRGPSAAYTMPEFAGIGRGEADWLIGELLDAGYLGRESDGTIDVRLAFEPPFEPPPEPRKRMLPEQLRRRVFQRDEHTCQHCGTGEELTVDHIYPEIRGGHDELDNLQTLCRRCNSRKGASLPS